MYKGQTDSQRPSSSVTISGLTEKQSAFVDAFLESGGGPGAAADAAQKAGYAKTSRAAARVRGAELLKNEKVLSALRDGLTRKLNAAASLGVSVLIELAENGPPSVRLQAAKELLDRGYGPIVSRNAHLVANTSIEDLLSQIDENINDALYDDEAFTIESEEEERRCHQ